MANYCIYCGKPLNSDGRCLYCSASSGRRTGKKKRSAFIILMAIVGALMLIVLMLVLLVPSGTIRNLIEKKEIDSSNVVERKETPSEYILSDTIERPDALEALKEIGMVTSWSSLSSSENVQSEAEAYKELTKRGFTQAPITTVYSSDGTYMEETEISASSKEVHPEYQTLYISMSGVIWSIQLVNGTVIANPLSLNTGDYWETIHFLSENGMLFQYDSATKAFIGVLPEPSEMHVRTVERIDAATLDAITAEEVDS